MHTVGPTLAAALTAAVLLSGCGGSPEPSPLPDPTKSASPSASASAAPTAPVMPEAAKAKTRVGAEALVRHFLSTLGYAGGSGDTATLRDTYTSECTRCEAIADGIDKTYAAGGSIVGGAWRPTHLKFYAIRRDIAYIDAIVHYEPQTWTKASGTAPRQSPAKRNVLKAFQLIWRDG
ncbi:MAG: DUF6318 family protein, partial [Marmoricola sp.]